MKPAAAQFFFGFTRLFKVPHSRCVYDTLVAGHPKHTKPKAMQAGANIDYRLDFVENLLGYVHEADEFGLPKESTVSPQEGSRKGRVAFSFATLDLNSKPRKTKMFTAVMMPPRASFAPFYLGGGEWGRDYSADKPTLAGRKRYLPRGKWSLHDMVQMSGIYQPQNPRQLVSAERRHASSMFFLESADRDSGGELIFNSQIRLHNVSKPELGALLFALTHGGDPDKPYRHMIGRAKPFGAGQLRVEAARLVVEPNDSDGLVVPITVRGAFEPESRPGAPSHAHAPYLEAFVNYMRLRGVAGYAKAAEQQPDTLPNSSELPTHP